MPEFQSEVVVIKALWPAKLQIFSIWSFIESLPALDLDLGEVRKGTKEWRKRCAFRII